MPEFVNWLKTVWTRFRSLWQRPAVKREIDEELRFHLEQRAAENIAAGMPPEEAAREARKRFGNVQSIREECREVRGASFGEATLKDIRFGLRMIAKNRSFTAMAVLSLAIGIGLNTTIFSVLDGVFLRPMGFKDSATIVRISEPDFFSYPHYRELSGQCRSLSGVVARRGERCFLRSREGREQVDAEIVSPNYFSVLKVGAAVGDVFSERDPRLRNDPVVVISYELWQSHFGGDPAIVGKAIDLVDDTAKDLRRSFIVLGVVQKGYKGSRTSWDNIEIWFPPRPEDWENRKAGDFSLLGRLAPGASEAQAQAEVEAIVRRLDLRNDKTGQPEQVSVMTEAHSNRGVQVLSMLIMALAGLVLLVACANVSSLLLARHEERRHEIAMRLALGADRWRLIRQLLVESLLLATLGAGFGLVLTAWAKNAVLALLPGEWLHFEFRLDDRVLGFAVALTLLATLAFGLAPAWRASRTDLALILKGEIPLGGKRWRRFRGRNTLVVGQLAVSVFFLVTAGLLLRAFLGANAAGFGFARKPMLQVTIGLNRETGLTHPFSWAQLMERVRGLPGVKQVSMATKVLSFLSDSGDAQRKAKVFLSGGDAAANTEGLDIDFNCVATNFFEVMGIPLLRGRCFEGRDDPSGASVVIISEAMARRYWPGTDPIGQTVRLRKESAPPAEIIGIVRDIVHTRIGEIPEPIIYMPLSEKIGGGILLVEMKGDPVAVASAIRREMRMLEEDVELVLMETQKQAIRFAMFPQWIGAWLSGVLGLLAFTLSAAGLYGVISHSVARRTHEIGVRMALGAQTGDVLRMILRQGLVLALAGLAMGLPAAFALGWIGQSALFGLSPADPITFLGSSILVIGVALSACYFPARRAAKIDPMVALRYE